MDDPLFYSDPTQPNPLIRVDEAYCDEFYRIRAGVVADTMTLTDSANHMHNCLRCANYLAYLKAGNPNPQEVEF